jgi:hypothetical protein
MEDRQFDALIKRLTQTHLSRLDVMRGVAAGAFAVLTGVSLSPEESAARRKRKNRRKRNHRHSGRRKDNHKGKRKRERKEDEQWERHPLPLSAQTSRYLSDDPGALLRGGRAPRARRRHRGV